MYESENVESLIPSDTRTWRKAEKIILTIYIVGVSLLGCLAAYADSDASISFLMKSDAFVEKIIDETNSYLPTEVADGITVEKIEVLEDSVIYVYRLDNVYVSQMDDEALNDVMYYTKNLILHEFTGNSEEDKIICQLTAIGYSYVYKYLDPLSDELCRIVISPEMFEMAVRGEASQITLSDLKCMVERYNQKIPHGEIYKYARVLEKVYIDNNDTELVYVSGCSMDREELMDLGITPEICDNFVLNDWSESIDGMMQLAMLNKMSLRFEFKTLSGDIYSKVVITPEMYSELEL